MKSKYLKMIGEIINERDLGIGEIHANGKELTSSSLDMLNEKATKKLSKLLHDFSEELIGEIVSFEHGMEGIEEMVELDSVLYKVHELVESLIKKRDKLLK